MLLIILDYLNFTQAFVSVERVAVPAIIALQKTLSLNP